MSWISPAACWFMAAGASGQLFCLRSAAVILEEWPASLNLYGVLRWYGQLCRRRLARGITATRHLGFPCGNIREMNGSSTHITVFFSSGCLCFTEECFVWSGPCVVTCVAFLFVFVHPRAVTPRCFACSCILDTDFSLLFLNPPPPLTVKHIYNIHSSRTNTLTVSLSPPAFAFLSPALCWHPSVIFIPLSFYVTRCSYSGRYIRNSVFIKLWLYYGWLMRDCRLPHPSNKMFLFLIQQPSGWLSLMISRFQHYYSHHCFSVFSWWWIYEY